MNEVSKPITIVSNDGQYVTLLLDMSASRTTILSEFRRIIRRFTSKDNRVHQAVALMKADPRLGAVAASRRVGAPELARKIRYAYEKVSNA